MKILITGAGGQLAWELERAAPEGYQLFCLARDELDISDASAVENGFDELQPDAVINAAAYTAVDQAETNAATAMAVNASGVRHLAQACARCDSYLLHISTDFVFDGQASRPYSTLAKPNPLNVYGASKLQGEHELERAVSWGLIRTGWVYSSHGTNFVKTMLRLMREKPGLNIVSDQFGTPTWAAGLAGACWACVDVRLQGKFHWSDAGVASWYDFAVAIQTLAIQKGLLQEAIPIVPIGTDDYPTPARRPAFSVLDKTELLTAVPSLKLTHWQLQLSHMLDELKG